MFVVDNHSRLLFEGHQICYHHEYRGFDLGGKKRIYLSLNDRKNSNLKLFLLITQFIES